MVCGTAVDTHKACSMPQAAKWNMNTVIEHVCVIVWVSFD